MHVFNRLSTDRSSMPTQQMINMRSYNLHWNVLMSKAPSQVYSLDHLSSPFPYYTAWNNFFASNSDLLFLISFERLKTKFENFCSITVLLQEMKQYLKCFSKFNRFSGQKFAMLEMKSTLSKILRNFELLPAVPEHKLILVSEAVLKSKNGMKLKLVKRQWDWNDSIQLLPIVLRNLLFFKYFSK